VLAWSWAACPFTVIGLVVHTNDALVSMLTVFALLAMTRPTAAGGLLGLAAAAKFSPVALLPLLLAPRRRKPRGALLCLGAFVAVVAISVFSLLPAGGLGYVWQRTVGYQMVRPDVFSAWALHPALHPIQILVAVFAVLLIVTVAANPRDRSLTRVCALAGAVTIAIQLPVTHWYYYYIIWFLPFALVGLLVRPVSAAEPVSEKSSVDEWASDRKSRELVLAGV
jgi:uncharacterized membrane protein